MSSRYLPIKELTTWTPRWIICGRVAEKSQLSTFKRSDGTPGKVGSVDIMDRNGDSIRATFWGEAAEKYIPFLEEGQVYTFSNGRVQVANKRYTNLLHGYELRFDMSAIIEKVPCTSNSVADNHEDTHIIPHIRKYNFTSLRDISVSSREPPYLIDLLVAIRKISSNEEQFINKSTHDLGVRRVCQVGDDSGYEMHLTFFGEHTKIINEISENCTNTILAIQNVQIRRFRGGLNGSTLRTSHIVVHPTLPEAGRLREWLDSDKASSYVWKSLSDTGFLGTEFTNPTESYKTSAEISFLSDVVEALPNLPQATSSSLSQGGTSTSQDIFTVVVEPTRLLYTNRAGEVTLLYPACHQCNRKVIYDESVKQYRCDVCSVTLETPSYRYMFAMHLVDSSGGRLLAKTFHDPGHIIMGKDAAELSSLLCGKKSISDIPIEVRQLIDYDVLWKKYLMRLRARRELFGEQERTAVSVIYAERLDFTSHGYRLLQEINSALTKLVIQQPIKKRRYNEDCLSVEQESTCSSSNVYDDAF